MGVPTAVSRGVIAVKSSAALCPPATWPSRPQTRGCCITSQLASGGVVEGLGAKCSLPTRPCRRPWDSRGAAPLELGPCRDRDADFMHVRHHQLSAMLSSGGGSTACCAGGAAASGHPRQLGRGREGSSSAEVARAWGNWRRRGRSTRRVVFRALADSETAEETANDAPGDAAELANEGEREERLQKMEMVPQRMTDSQLSSSESTGFLSKGLMESFLYPDKDDLPDDVEMSIWDHLEELRQRVFFSAGAVGVAITICFTFVKDLVRILEAPVYSQGVRFLQLSPGEYFFTTLKVAGYSGLLLGSPVILYEIIAFVVPGLTRGERKFLAPIVLGSSVLFYVGLFFSYTVLTPAALNFFVNYSEGVVESLWSIDQYFEFVLVLMLSTGLAFQVPVIQLLLGQTGLVTGDQMLGVWKYVVVGAVTAAAVLTPSTDPLTQLLLAGPLMGLYLGGAATVRALEKGKEKEVT